jgi:hypothetical protein
MSSSQQRRARGSNHDARVWADVNDNGELEWVQRTR